jgi:hypothetical protein
MATEKLKQHRSPSIDQIPADLIKAGGRTILSKIHKLINSIQELPQQCKQSITVLMFNPSMLNDF